MKELDIFDDDEEQDEKQPFVEVAGQDAVDKSISQPNKKATRVPKISVRPFELDGKRYLLLPFPKDPRRFKIYDASDDDFETQLGEFEIDPISGTASRLSWF